MEAHIEIGNKKLSSIREASSQVSYSRDYVTRLAREGKIFASQIGRQWYVDLDSLKNYAEVSRIEADIRKAHLSEKRKQEQIFRSAKEQHETAREKTVATAHTKAVAAAGSVLAVGLLAGVFGYSMLMAPNNFDAAISQTTATNQYSQTAANAKAVLNTNPSAVSDPATQGSGVNTESSAVETTESISEGILVLPVGTNNDPAAVFSDEVRIRTATSGQQTAVLVDINGIESDREVPFVVVPVKTDSN
jgi:excisionase family DNA binding protein